MTFESMLMTMPVSRCVLQLVNRHSTFFPYCARLQITSLVLSSKFRMNSQTGSRDASRSRDRKEVLHLSMYDSLF